MSTKKKSIKGTKTEANLVAAYMSESAAYSRYTYYASQAEKEKIFSHRGSVYRDCGQRVASRQGILQVS